MTKHFEYHGSSLTWDDYEMLALARISEPHRRDETALFQTKWFDYRHLHPVAATYMYADRYAQAVRDIFAQTKDRDEALAVVPFAPSDVFQCNELIGFWLARQALDRLGIRYEFALRFAMNRFALRGWSYFPRPNQLYTEELLLDTRDAWNKECAHSLQIAKHHRFTAQHYIAHRDQIDYQAWLVKQIQTREHPHRPISRLLSEKLISKNVINDVFGEKVLNKAMQLNAV